MSIRRLALAAGAVLLSVNVLAQEDDIEAVIGQSRSSVTIRDLQAQASAEPPKTDDRHELAIFYHKRGMANRRLGNYDRAVSDLQLALENNQPNRLTPDGWGDRWRIQGDLIGAYWQRGDWFTCIDFSKRVAHEYRQSDLFIYHISQLVLMDLYNAIGQWADADKARHESDATLRRLRNMLAWATLSASVLSRHSRYMGTFFKRQGNYTAAERESRASLEWAEKAYDVAQRTRPQGHQFIRIEQDNLGTTKVDLAEILAEQGKYGEAEGFARAGFEDAFALFGFNTTAVSRGLRSIGWARFQQGDLVGAEKYYRYSLAAVEGPGILRHSGFIAERRADLGNALIVQGRWNEALKVFEERDQGLRSDAAQFRRYGSGYVGWAYVLHKTGQSQRAAEMAERMVAGHLKRPVPNRWYVAQLRGVLGMALAASGKTAEALKAYQESVPELIHRDQDDATAENTGFWRAFWQRVILESYLDLLAKLQASGEVPATLDLVDESFWVADIARGSSVQEAITATAARTQLPDRNLADLARKEQDALNRIVALNQILARLAAAPEQERLNKIISDMRAEIERLRKEHAALRADIRKRYPEYADLIDPKPAGIGDVRRALAPGEALVSIYLGESQSYVWTIFAGGKAAFRVVPLKRDEIESDVRQLRKAVDFGDGNVAQLRPFDLARAHKLYREFLEPDEPLWKESQVLNVIPHGALGQLPFALLVTAAPSQQPSAGAQAAYREVPWLVRKVAIAQLPSASAFAALRRAPPGKAERQPFVGFGDPLFTADAGAGGRRGVVRNLVVQKVADTTEERLSEMAQGKRPQPQAKVVATRTLSQAFALLSALPDTSDELKEIATVLKADVTRDVFVNREATE